MKLFMIMGALLVSIGLAGCATTVDYVRDAPERVAAADWSEMETVKVDMTEFAYQPDILHFQTGQPYKLEIHNTGMMKHYFTAEDFFKSIATRKVQSNTDGEIKAPYFTAIEVYPGRSLDIYFIPVRKGSYDLICTIEVHAEHGMLGQIIVE